LKKEKILPHLLGIDASTTGVKALLTDESGNVTGTATAALPLSTPKPLWSEQDPADWWQGAVSSIRQVLGDTGLSGDEVAAVGLTGAYATDRAGAAGTLLLDIKTRDWSAEVLQALEIPAVWLSPTHKGPEITAYISEEAARATGLKAGTPVVGGGGDQAAQAVGVGAVQPGIIALTLGTLGVVFASTDQPFIEPRGRLHAFCHAVPGRWHLMGVMLSATGSLRWYRDTLAPGDDYDTLLAPAAEVSPGSEGLLFLPYLTGERTPYPDPLARGAFVGLTVRHTQPHLTRAVLEGVGAGVYQSVAKACEMAVQVTGRTEPGPAVPVYTDTYPRYRALYPALAPEFEAIARVGSRHPETETELA